MSKLFKLVIIILLLLVFQKPAFGQSNYVLPYPSFMPGTILYKAHLVYEDFSKIWSFGDISRFKNDLKFSDKYLVEAKTLFEYNQYLLASEALRKSDDYFTRAKKRRVEIDKKNEGFNTAVLNMASSKHIEILTEVEKTLPEKFSWQAEKKKAVDINLKDIINEAIKTRSL